MAAPACERGDEARPEPSAEPGPSAEAPTHTVVVHCPRSCACDFALGGPGELAAAPLDFDFFHLTGSSSLELRAREGQFLHLVDERVPSRPRSRAKLALDGLAEVELEVPGCAAFVGRAERGGRASG